MTIFLYSFFNLGDYVDKLHAVTVGLNTALQPAISGCNLQRMKLRPLDPNAAMALDSLEKIAAWLGTYADKNLLLGGQYTVGDLHRDLLEIGDALAVDERTCLQG